MQKTICTLLFLLLTLSVFSQSAFLKRTLDDSYLIDKYEILNGKFIDSVFYNGNISRKEAVEFLENYSNNKDKKLSIKQQQEIKHFISKSGEWASNETPDSEYPLFKTIYKKPAEMIYVNKGNYFLTVNPIIAYQQMIETGNTKQNLFINTKGLEVRGVFAKRLGFYSMFTDNQERGPLHFQNYLLSHNAAPSMGYYKAFKQDSAASNYKAGYGLDYINATGYIDASLLKNIVNVSFGYDRFQMGDGYRSLFLSDFSAPYTFLKINTKFWKINYQNLFMEIMPDYARRGDNLLDKKYAAVHQLSINATKWLNLGLFESVTFGRKNHFDFGYMNPIILYRSIEQNNGSPDNAMIGINGKIHTGRNAILYGQIILDEFNFSKIKARNGWWGNKFGIQMGIKTADIFGIKNLVAQAELNIVRPFTYSFRDSTADYTHYNQPLAHPYGANFMEASLQLKYKPTERLYLTLKTFYNKQGRDTLSNVSFGSNIFKDYNLRNAETGIKLLNGYASSVKFVNLNASYELRDNLYIDLGLNYRSEIGTHTPNPTFSSTQVYTGFRLNMARRQYDY